MAKPVLFEAAQPECHVLGQTFQKGALLLCGFQPRRQTDGHGPNHLLVILQHDDHRIAAVTAPTASATAPTSGFRRNPTNSCGFLDGRRQALWDLPLGKALLDVSTRRTCARVGKEVLLPRTPDEDAAGSQSLGFHHRLTRPPYQLRRPLRTADELIHVSNPLENRVQMGRSLFGLLLLTQIDAQEEQALLYRLGLHQKPSSATVRVIEPVLELVGLSLFHATAKGCEHPRLLDARIRLHHGLADQCLDSALPLRRSGLVYIQISEVR